MKLKSLDTFSNNHLDKIELSSIYGGKHYGGSVNGSGWSADVDGTHRVNGSGSMSDPWGIITISRNTYGNDIQGTITYDGHSTTGEWPWLVVQSDGGGGDDEFSGEITGA